MMPARDPDPPFCPIPSLSHVRCRVFLDFKTNETVASAFGVPTAGVRIFECPVSGLRFRRAPAAGELAGYYGVRYHRFYGAQSETAIVPEREDAARVAFLRKHCPRGKVMDVGCSTGVFATQLVAAGYDVAACDISEAACEEARGRLGAARVRHGTIESMSQEFAEGSFDAVTLMDVIEHFENIVEPLRAIRRLLKPGGVLFVRTPTLRSPFFCIADASYTLTRGRYTKAIQRIYHAEHLYFFNHDSLQRLLSDTGFEMVTMAFDPLFWRTFKEAELRHGIAINTALTAVYFVSRLAGLGHGIKVIARRREV